MSDEKIILGIYGEVIDEIEKHKVPYVVINISKGELEKKLEYFRDIDDVIEEWKYGDFMDGDLKLLEVNPEVGDRFFYKNDTYGEIISVDRASWSTGTFTIMNVDVTNCFTTKVIETLYIDRDTGEQYEPLKVIELYNEEFPDDEIESIDEIEWGIESGGGTNYYRVEDYNQKEVIENSFE
jgi:hypothetical protein